MKCIRRHRNDVHTLILNDHIYMIFILLAHVPMAQLPSYVSNNQGDIIGSAYKPEVASTCLDERVPTMSSLKNGDCHLIVAVEVNQLVSEMLVPRLDGSHRIYHLQMVDRIISHEEEVSREAPPPPSATGINKQFDSLFSSGMI